MKTRRLFLVAAFLCLGGASSLPAAAIDLANCDRFSCVKAVPTLERRQAEESTAVPAATIATTAAQTIGTTDGPAPTIPAAESTVVGPAAPTTTPAAAESTVGEPAVPTTPAEITVSEPAAPTPASTVPPANVASPTSTIQLPPVVPSLIETVLPSVIQTLLPTAIPSVIETVIPTVIPSVIQTVLPSVVETVVPSVVPSVIETVVPSVVPSIIETVVPSVTATIVPSVVPTRVVPPIIVLPPIDVDPPVPTVAPTRAPPSPAPTQAPPSPVPPIRGTPNPVPTNGNGGGGNTPAPTNAPPQPTNAPPQPTNPTPPAPTNNPPPPPPAPSNGNGNQAPVTPSAIATPIPIPIPIPSVVPTRLPQPNALPFLPPTAVLPLPLGATPLNQQAPSPVVGGPNIRIPDLPVGAITPTSPQQNPNQIPTLPGPGSPTSPNNGDGSSTGSSSASTSNSKPLMAGILSTIGVITVAGAVTAGFILRSRRRNVQERHFSASTFADDDFNITSSSSVVAVPALAAATMYDRESASPFSPIKRPSSDAFSDVTDASSTYTALPFTLPMSPQSNNPRHSTLERAVTAVYMREVSPLAPSPPQKQPEQQQLQSSVTSGPPLVNTSLPSTIDVSKATYTVVNTVQPPPLSALPRDDARQSTVTTFSEYAMTEAETEYSADTISPLRNDNGYGNRDMSSWYTDDMGSSSPQSQVRHQISHDSFSEYGRTSFMSAATVQSVILDSPTTPVEPAASAPIVPSKAAVQHPHQSTILDALNNASTGPNRPLTNQSVGGVNSYYFDEGASFTDEEV